MADNNTTGVNKFYMISISIIIFVLPAISFVIERFINNNNTYTIALIGKWFIFYAAGLRLLVAGIKQVTKPAFTAKEIFHFTSNESYAVIKELGFANICAGIVGIASLFFPAWRIVSAFSSGLYYGFAAVGHLTKKSAGANEKFALITDIIIFIALLIYVLLFFKINN